MLCDQDILEENRTILGRRFRLLREAKDVDLALIGISPEAAQELLAITDLQLQRAADAAAPLFGFALEDQIIRILGTPQATPLAKQSRLEIDLQEDALLMLTNRWTSSRQSPEFAGTVLGLSKKMIDAFARATYTDVRRVATAGVRPRMCVKPQYIFHAARNLTMHTGQRTNLAVSNSRYNSF